MSHGRFFVLSSALVVAVIITGAPGGAFEEGMYPISDLAGLNLKAMGS